MYKVSQDRRNISVTDTESRIEQKYRNIRNSDVRRHW